jgi:hypothetical protein
MTNISKRLEQIVSKELSKNIIPIKTEEGILVGDVLISSQGPIKNLLKNTTIIYKEIHLNSVAIKLANMLAFKRPNLKTDEIYRADQDYGRWFTDSQLLRAQYQKALSNRDSDKADMLWARYIESRDRTTHCKNRAEALVKF